jgi:hypothetical protein
MVAITESTLNGVRNAATVETIKAALIQQNTVLIV